MLGFKLSSRSNDFYHDEVKTVNSVMVFIGETGKEALQMPIPVNQITDKQLQEVLSYTEGHFLDLKAKEIKPVQTNAKAISAFANADGGELYVGIAENVTLPFPHKWDGFAKPEDANAHVQVFENLFLWEKIISYNFLSHPS